MNPLRGETPLIAGGKSYTLVLDINAQCEAEEALGMPMASIVVLGDGSVKVVRALLWASLLRHHSELSLEDAGRLMDQATFPIAKEAVAKALRNAEPEAAPEANPRKAGRAGTGSKA